MVFTLIFLIETLGKEEVMSNRVEWNRIKGDVEFNSLYADVDSLIDENWSIDKEEQTVNAIIQTGDADLPAVDVDVTSLVGVAGSSWRTMMYAEDSSAVPALKSYLKKVYSLQKTKPSIYIDTVRSDDGTLAKVMRQKLVWNKKEVPFNETYDRIKSRFDDVKELVIGTEKSKQKAEIQMLFGDDVVVDKSPQAGDIINHGLFIHINGQTYISYGVNRLVCTNGLVRNMTLFNDTMLSSLKDETLKNVRMVSEWFKELPDKKVDSVRCLSVLLNGFPSNIIKSYWKTWSEKIELKQLTYYEVVNDLTSHANRSLGYTRQVCTGIQSRFEKLQKHECPVCSASV